MPEAAYCMACNAWVWVSYDGGCSQGHRRSNLRSVYEAPAVAGVPVPPGPKPNAAANDEFRLNVHEPIKGSGNRIL